MIADKLIRPIAYLIALVMTAAAVLLFWPDDGKDDSYQVTAYFQKAIGLFPNSDVNILGVPVGTVRKVEPEGPRVKVTMELSKAYEVPADATAQIIPISVISDRFVELTPAYTGGPVMQDGAVLGVEQTRIPAELDDVFKQLKKLLDAIKPGGPGEPGALGELIVELDRTFKGREDDLQGALTEGSQLTRTLATTKEDLQGLLANLDSLFAKLATRSGEFDTLNENLIAVLSAIAESRDDLEGMLINLADLSTEVTDLARDDGEVLERDLRRTAKVLKTVLENEKSVRESLTWLPILGWGLSHAYHKGDVQAVDIRDNATSKIECEILEDLPEGPIKDLLEDVCKHETGEPGGDPLPIPPAPQDAPLREPPLERPELGCDEGIKRVKQQLKRIRKLGLPEDVKRELLDPLRKKLTRLAKECEELKDKVEDPDELLDEILSNAPDVGALPRVKDAVDGLTGSASGDSAVPDTGSESEERSWFGDFLGFLGL